MDVFRMDIYYFIYATAVVMRRTRVTADDNVQSGVEHLLNSSHIPLNPMGGKQRERERS